MLQMKTNMIQENNHLKKHSPPRNLLEPKTRKKTPSSILPKSQIASRENRIFTAHTGHGRTYANLAQRALSKNSSTRHHRGTFRHSKDQSYSKILKPAKEKKAQHDHYDKGFLSKRNGQIDEKRTFSCDSNLRQPTFFALSRPNKKFHEENDFPLSAKRKIILFMKNEYMQYKGE